jgi:hypothetical protein
MWIVKHAVTGETVGEHSTKKAAVVQAEEMTSSHEKVDARHEGQHVAFFAVKYEPPVLEEGPPPDRKLQ